MTLRRSACVEEQQEELLEETEDLINIQGEGLSQGKSYPQEEEADIGQRLEVPGNAEDSDVKVHSDEIESEDLEENLDGDQEQSAAQILTNLVVVGAEEDEGLLLEVERSPMLLKDHDSDVRQNQTCGFGINLLFYFLRKRSGTWQEFDLSV